MRFVWRVFVGNSRRTVRAAFWMAPFCRAMRLRALNCLITSFGRSAFTTADGAIKSRGIAYVHFWRKADNLNAITRLRHGLALIKISSARQTALSSREKSLVGRADLLETEPFPGTCEECSTRAPVSAPLFLGVAAGSLYAAKPEGESAAVLLPASSPSTRRSTSDPSWGCPGWKRQAAAAPVATAARALAGPRASATARTRVGLRQKL
mmetsp:Transcript_42765/g.96017  ORF Transcript_42765/g.96017 Transcript_42765/m.96017 type:complete len:209 (-) Transcript_42765:332-958(-)